MSKFAPAMSKGSSLSPSALTPGEHPSVTNEAEIKNALGRMPLTFIENKGQVDAKVKYYSKTGSGTVWLTEDEVVFDFLRPKVKEGAKADRHRHRDPMDRERHKEREFERQVVRMRLQNQDSRPVIAGRVQKEGIVNYFKGNDPAKWRTDIPTFGEVYYANVYKGIDMRFYASGDRGLEYDFIVHPGSDPQKIAVAFEGIDGMSTDAKGDMIIQTAFGEMRQKAPRIYQTAEGGKLPVEGRFTFLSGKKTSYGFQLTAYDQNKELVIDPEVIYSTYLGGSDGDEGYSIAIDSSGNAYVTGFTNSTDFPRVNAKYPNLWGGQDAFIFKVNANGDSVVYSTYLVGSALDNGYGIAVDSSGDAYVTGYTNSTDFPRVNAKYPNLWGNSDAFIFKINASGDTVIYSTYLGGSGGDEGHGIAVDNSGNVYVTGGTASSDFPKVNAKYPNLWGGQDAFIFKYGGPEAPNCSISGVVKDAITGKPLSGVTIKVGSLSATTDSSGHYSLSGSICGKQTVTVSVPGYAQYSKSIGTSGSSTLDINLTSTSTVYGQSSPSGYSQDPVNTATGNYIFTRKDLEIPGKGFPFVFERNYNSQDAVKGPLGFGWNHSYNPRLTVKADSTVTIRWGDGKTETWTPDGSGGYTPQYGVFDRLMKNANNTWSLIKKDQTRYNFTAAGRLRTIRDKNSNTLTCAYTSGNLIKITDTAGREIDFTYDGSNRITQITDPIGRTILFSYDSAGDLVSSTDMNGNVTTFTYDINHQMLTATDPRGNTFVTNTYDEQNRVVTAQKDAKMGKTTFVYDRPNRCHLSHYSAPKFSRTIDLIAIG